VTKVKTSLRLSEDDAPVLAARRSVSPEELDWLTPGSEEWNKVYNDICAMDINFFSRTEEKANARGDHETAQHARLLRENAEKAKEEVNKITTLNQTYSENNEP